MFEKLAVVCIVTVLCASSLSSCAKSTCEDYCDIYIRCSLEEPEEGFAAGCVEGCEVIYDNNDSDCHRAFRDLVRCTDDLSCEEIWAEEWEEESDETFVNCNREWDRVVGGDCH